MKRLELISRYQIDFDLDFSFLKSESLKRWPRDLRENFPSFVPQKGDEVLFFVAKKKKGSKIHSNEAIDAIVAVHLFLPNATGLVVAEKIIREKEIELPPFPVWVAGYDHLTSLSCVPKFGHMVPHLLVEDKENFEYHYLPYGSVIDHDEIIMAFKR